MYNAFMLTQIRNFLLFGFIGFMLVGFGIGGYFLGKQEPSFKKVQMIVSVTPSPSSVQDAPNAKITTMQNPSGDPSEETLSLVVPSSWKTIQDTTNTYQLSYNPILFTATAGEGMIFLNNNEGINGKNERVYTFEKKQYDGNSRHIFINEHMGNTYTYKKTYEKSYNIDGKSALIIYNVDYRDITLLGIAPLDASSALLITGTNTEEAYIKGILQTLKVLK